MSLFRFNASIQNTWRQSLTTILQILRRVVFVVEDSFSFGDFDPQIDWGGMTVTLVSIPRARYLKIWKMLWISVSFEGTVAAPLTTTIKITIPGTAQGVATAIQAYIFRLFEAATIQAGTVLIRGGNNTLEFQKLNSANYTAGAVTLRLNGFFEVT